MRDGQAMAEIPQRGLDTGREALRRFLVGDDDLGVMLTKITMIATETVAGCDIASITMMPDGGTPRTAVFTDKLALALDEKQYEFDTGPCLSAIRHRGVEHSSTATEDRWPAFSVAAAEVGVLATLSAPLVHGESAVGGLNLYSHSVETYDDDARETASLFADQLGVAAANATIYAEGYELAQQLLQAMESRAVIEQAKGILMAAEHCTPEEAFDMLRRASQGQNRKLRTIATDIVERYSRGGG
jgi:GAF domain-containing protein